MIFEPRQQEGMPFHAMLHYYPWIIELFAKVSDLIHAGCSPEMAMGYLDQRDRRISERIIKEHRKDVHAKLTRFAQVLADNDATTDLIEDEPCDEEPPPITAASPEPCPYCGSVDTDGNSCRWCRAATSTKERRAPMIQQAISKLTAEQAQFTPSNQEYVVASALIYLCQYLPSLAAAIAGSDKTVKDCYKSIENYARENRVNVCAVITPETAAKLFCEFYDTDPVDISQLQSTAQPAAPTSPPPVPTPAPAIPSNAVNILDFLDMD